MPYKKKYSRKRYGARYNRAVHTMSRTANLARQVLSLKRMVNVEFKNHDNLIVTGTNVGDATGVITQLSNIAQGDTTISRDGSQCKIVSILIKGFVEIHASATNTVVRLMLIQDKQTNEAIYATSDLLSDVSTVDSVVASRNLDNTHRFRILWDKQITLSNTGQGIKFFNFYKKVQILLRYDNAAAAITSLTQNSLSLLRISNEATNEPGIVANIRVRFIDN